MDTVGNVIDKLFTVNMKICNNQSNPKKLENLFIQRCSLKNEIDDNVNDIFSNSVDDNDIIRPQHKTY